MSIDQEKLQQIQDLYESDKISEAFHLMKSLSLEPSLIESTPILKQINNEYYETRQILSEFEDKSDWISETEGSVQIRYKKVPDSPTISLLCESVINVPLFNFITLIYETDLFPDWIPFCTTAVTLHRLSKSRKIVFVEADIIKVSKRAVCLLGYGFNLLSSDGVVMVISKSVQGYINTDTTMAQINFFGCLIKPLSDSSIQVKVISNFDPNIFFLPYSLLNWLIRKFAKILFKKLAQKSKNFEHSEYPKRMLLPENAEFYQHLKKSLDEYLVNLSV